MVRFWKQFFSHPVGIRRRVIRSGNGRPLALLLLALLLYIVLLALPGRI